MYSWGMGAKRRAPVTHLAFAAIVFMAFYNVSETHAQPVSCPRKSTGGVTTSRLINADKKPGDWLTAGQDWRQSYYSPLTQITKDNAGTLGFSWSYETPYSTTFQSTPLVVDGVMFSSGNGGNVYALDAQTGAPHWTFTPNKNGGANRGVAVWGGKVYVGTIDGYLYALDACTGAVAWKKDTIIDRSRAYTSTGAPYIAKNRVVIGNSGGEFDARGYITAYETGSGKQAWRFFTVPGDPRKGYEHPELRMAAKTWDPNSAWEVGLGGTAWDGMAYDPTLNLLYVGTGNGTPWTRTFRSPAGGDNLFLSSILAINPDTGRLRWFYQVVPGDNWDYTAAQKLILADLDIEGVRRKVIMQAPKSGFFYVIDRTSGKLLSAKPFAQTTWASHIDMQTGRPVETAQGDYSQGPKLIFPSEQGAHNWQPMSFNPKTGLVYIPVLEAPEIFALPEEPFEYRRAKENKGVIGRFLFSGVRDWYTDIPKNWPPIETLAAGQPDYRSRSFLRAWDPVYQHIAWEVETTSGGVGFAGLNRGGVMSTASGLVFQGDYDGYLVVRDAQTGAVLHRIQVGNGMIAGPMTYLVDGRQYVAIMANGDDAGGRIVAFRLGGGAVPQPVKVVNKPTVPDRGAPERITLGKGVFERHCVLCHANAGRAPDLTKATAEVYQAFMNIVLKGQRADKGMPSFDGILTAQEAEAVQEYVIHQAWERYRRERPAAEK